MGVILCTVGDTQYRGDIMMHVGDIMSTVVDIIFCDLSTVVDIMMHVGRYHEYRGGVQYRGSTQITKHSPHSTEHPQGTHDISHVHHDIPHGTKYPQNTHDIPHGTEHLGTEHTLYRVINRVIMSLFGIRRFSAVVFPIVFRSRFFRYFVSVVIKSKILLS